ncbi:MAG TPA: DnaD domain protein [Chloroflexota bacterium]|nr:DnaD domain protein [Chloroflexota bacterium]
MKPFAGFPKSSEAHLTPLPDAFFDQLLPQLDDFAELKVLLHVVAVLGRQAEWPRCVSRGELARDEVLQASLTVIGDLRPLDALLGHALERASQRGALLRITVRDGDGADEWYLLNTERGRALLRELRVPGERAVALRQRIGSSERASIETARPNAFGLYEQNIGLLTRMIAEELMEAEANYPEAWIEDAFRIAVERNKRNWRYIKTILSRWSEEGKGEDGTFRRHSGEVHDPERYLKGEFGHLFRH